MISDQQVLAGHDAAEPAAGHQVAATPAESSCVPEQAQHEQARSEPQCSLAGLDVISLMA